MYVLPVFVLLVCAVFAENNNGLFELNILHYNDFHAHFDEIALNGSPCTPSQGECIGGYERLYSALRQALEAEPDSLLFNGGDTFQGTMWYNFLRWNVTLHFMNLLPQHDAHVLGNHEFDNGIEGLLPYLKGLNSPMLGANVNTTFEPELSPYVKNHIVVERKGRKIGIIGILLTGFTAPIGKVIMEDELEAVRREATLLTEQHVDIIIVLSHVGYATDMRLAALMPPEVDIIVGAHTHTLLYNGAVAPDGSRPAGLYPTVVTQASGHRIPVVQASAYTRYLGDIKLFFDDAGKIVSWEGQPIYLGTSIVKDERMASLIAPWREEVHAEGKEVLSASLTELNRGDCRRRECNIGSWICDNFIGEAVPRATGPAWGYAHACLINNGGIRAHVSAGEITTEGILMAMPFENKVQVYDLKGSYLLEALEFSVSLGDAQGFNRMVQIGGIRVVYNATAAPGSRVLSARVRCLQCDVPRYEPLDVEVTYRLITQDFIANGGGGFSMLANNRENVEDVDVDYLVLRRSLRRQGTVIQDLDGRIQIVH
ncbi:apyrase [Bicyclus anynana]|uniref:apyrase n=1 Tax=Bicyclus anynana TaxID=110368 RepID=A0A6J1NEY3_BICAN|nr:apyrase [Bicyclus anynana]XP_052738933.1 apyrase [Bicyclus anynana]